MFVVNKPLFNYTVIKNLAQYSSTRVKTRFPNTLKKTPAHNDLVGLCTLKESFKNPSRVHPSLGTLILSNHYATVGDKTSKDNPGNKSKSKNSRNLIISLVVLASSVIGVYTALNYKKPDKKLPVQVQKKEKKISTKAPADSNEIPSHVTYLLVGGGTASFAAFRAIKSSDPTAKVLVISSENTYPYMRPPLSKEIWFNDDRTLIKKLKFKQWNGSERSLFYEPDDFYVDCKELENVPNGGVAVAKGWSITKIDPVKRIALLDDGKEISYDKCLIATGAKPKNLPVLEDPKLKDKITLFRTIYDFETLEEICDKAESVVVIGGGFLGSEISCALARYGKTKSLKVKQIFNEKGNMAKILPSYLSEWTTTKVQAEGVEVVPDVEVIGAELGIDKKLILKLKNGSQISADHAIVAVGVEPNTELAITSDLETDPELGGFLVNAELEARSNLYAAGDCACFYDTKLGRRRVEHHDHAVVSGRLAGENMTGARKPYVHQSMFWSDLGPDIGYEAIGIVDSKLPTVAVFAVQEKKSLESTVNESEATATPTPPTPAAAVVSNVEQSVDPTNYNKGIIFYLKNNVIVGIVLWNVFNRMSTARQIIKEHRQFEDLNEVAKLFNIYEE